MKWAIRNEALEALASDVKISSSSSSWITVSGAVGYFNMSQLAYNCGAMLLTGIGGVRNHAVATFVARNIASVTGHNVIFLNGEAAYVQKFVDTGHFTSMLNTKSNRSAYKSMAYAICLIPPSNMAMKGY